MQVIAGNPSYGDVVPGFNTLRKMRLHVPGLNCGKSGGYRIIYSFHLVDEVPHVVFVACYFKGDKSDLSRDEYKVAAATAQAVFKDDDTPWEDHP